MGENPSVLHMSSCNIIMLCLTDNRTNKCISSIKMEHGSSGIIENEV